MDYFNSIILGIIQGLTEFLPVSSTAHLILIPKLLKIKEALLNSMAFDIFLHLGTLFAVVLFYWQKLLKILKSFFSGIFSVDERKTIDFKIGVYLIIGTLPAFLFGYFLKDIIETIFRGTFYVASFLILFSFFLLIADKIKNAGREINDMNIMDAIIIGCFQAIALLPGVSRSGISITAGLLRGFKRADAAEFSFLLSIPAIFGAVVFGTKDLLKYGVDGNLLILISGFIFSFLSGFFAIKFLISFVKKYSYLIFVIYRVIFGIIIIVFAILNKI